MRVTFCVPTRVIPARSHRGRYASGAGFGKGTAQVCPERHEHVFDNASPI